MKKKRTTKKKYLVDHTKIKHYRNMVMMLPKNHNQIIKLIVGVWDKKSKKGSVLTELNAPNAYIKKEINDVTMFNTIDDLNNEMQKRTQELMPSLTDSPYTEDRHFESEETFLLTLLGENKQVTIKCKNQPINIIEEDDNVIITLFNDVGKLPFKDIKHIGFSVDVTNDPTPEFSGSVVSLGYYCWRFAMSDVTIKNTSPFVVVGKLKNFKNQFTRPTRRVI